MGIIAKVDDNAGNNKEGFLPNVVWKETGRDFHTGEKDATFEQVLRAETIQDEEVKAKRLLKAVKGDKPSKSTRKRRVFSRGER